MTGLLLDSHIFLWYNDGDPRLDDQCDKLIASSPIVFLSAASIWELSIKIAARKLTPRPLLEQAQAADFTILPVSAEHAEAVIPLPRHHRDPFDHLLLAQAKVEGLTLVTHDERLARYGVAVILV